MRRTSRIFLPSIALQLCLCFLANNLAFAATKALDLPAVKQRIDNRGVGNRAQIIETDGSSVVGTILSVNADSFQMQPKYGKPVELFYTQVAAVRGPGLSKGTKIVLGIGIGVGASVGIGAIVIHHELSKPWFPNGVL